MLVDPSRRRHRAASRRLLTALAVLAGALGLSVGSAAAQVPVPPSGTLSDVIEVNVCGVVDCYGMGVCGRDSPDPGCSGPIVKPVRNVEEAAIDGVVAINAATCPVMPDGPDCDPDGDGIGNEDDACPNQNGGGWHTGCPNSDGDALDDPNDRCPTEAGAHPSGCPDTDGDGKIDKEDACPTEASTDQADGCPRVHDPSPPADPPELEGDVNHGDGDEWNGDPNETHDTTETAGGGQGAYGGSAAAAGLSCDPGDRTYGQMYFDMASPDEVTAGGFLVVTSAEDAVIETLTLPQMPPLSATRFQETKRSTGFRRYSILVDGRAVAVLEVVSQGTAGWVPYRFAACSKVTNAGVPAR